MQPVIHIKVNLKITPHNMKAFPSSFHGIKRFNNANAFGRGKGTPRLFPWKISNAQLQVQAL